MAHVAGMQDESRCSRQRIDLFDGGFESADHVRVSSLIETHMAIADLDETELAFGLVGANFRNPAEAVRLQHPAFNYAEGASTRPRHALQKTATINAVVVMVMQNGVFIHVASLRGLKISPLIASWVKALFTMANLHRRDLFRGTIAG